MCAELLARIAAALDEAGVPYCFIGGQAEATIAQARTETIDGVPVKFASLNNLIVYKLIAGRPRDIEDVRTMIAANCAQVEARYITKWLTLFDRESGANFEEVFLKLWDEIGSE